MLTAAGDKVDRTSLSRYVSSHADALNPQRRGRETIVDFDALSLHRQQNIRLGGDAKPFAAARSKVDESKAKLIVDRQLKELDLAERQGVLTLVPEVEEAAIAAIGMMRGAFALAVNDIAETMALALASEARLIRPHLRALEIKALDAFVKALADRDLAGNA
jgi:hypothetical protein